MVVCQVARRIRENAVVHAPNEVVHTEPAVVHASKHGVYADPEKRREYRRDWMRAKRAAGA